MTPTVTITATPSLVTLGSSTSVSVVVTVAGTSGTPTGSVSFSGGGYTSTSQALSNGTYTYTIPASDFKTVGTDTLTASYSGNTNYTSGSGTTTLSVNNIATSMGTYTFTVTPTSSPSFPQPLNQLHGHRELALLQRTAKRLFPREEPFLLQRGKKCQGTTSVVPKRAEMRPGLSPFDTYNCPLFPVPYSLFPVPCSLFPVPAPVPCGRHYRAANTQKITIPYTHLLSTLYVRIPCIFNAFCNIEVNSQHPTSSNGLILSNQNIIKVEFFIDSLKKK